MKSVTKQCTLAVFLFFLMHTFLGAQEVQLKLIQGSIILNDQLITDVFKTVEIEEKDEISLPTQSIALAYTENAVIELREGKYTFQEIEKRSKARSSSFTGAFIDVLVNEGFQKKEQSLSGSTTRGASTSPVNYYYPKDEFKILSSSLNLEIGNEDTKITGGVFVVRNGDSDTLFLAPSGKLELTDLKPGHYHWGYEIQYLEGTSKVTEEYLNSFMVLDENQRERLIEESLEFKDKLKSFSEATREILYQNYLENQKLIY